MKHIIYSQTNDPTKWANMDYDMIQFATAGDAKKAETMFNALLKELDALRLLAAGDDGGRHRRATPQPAAGA